MIGAKFKKYASPEFILIYQMGKVGSTSLEAAIEKSANLHTLYNNHPCPYNHTLRYLGLNAWAKERFLTLVKKAILCRRKELKIITIFREPLSRNLSMLMQDYAFWHCHAFRNGYISGKSEDANVPRTVFEKAFNHDYPYRWFDNEIKKLTSINIFAESQALIDNGWAIYEKGRYKVLAIEFGMLNRVIKEVEVIKFIGQKLELKNQNKGAKKWYAPIYNGFDAEWKECLKKKYDADFCDEELAKIYK